MDRCLDTQTPDMIVPIKIEADWPDAEELVQTLRFQKEQYGIRRFLLSAPSIGWRVKEFPPITHFEKLAKLFAQVRDRVRPEGIECGWWNMLSVKSGGTKAFGRIIRSDGSPAPASACPLDPVFRNTFAKANARFAQIAQPDFIFFEDDYAINASCPDGLGCFCELHLAEFARRAGRSYTREELVAALTAGTEDSLALLKQWRRLTRDSLVGMAEVIRQELDLVAPQIPMGSMQPGSCDRDGDTTEAVARALAGPKHTPFSRLFGAVYCDLSNGKNLPEAMYHPLHSRQHIPEPFRYYHESDTYPHTRFYISAKKMGAMMAAAYSVGFDGSTFQTAQILDDRNEEQAYGRMYRRECLRFNAAGRIAGQCRVRGVEICFDPFYNTIEANATEKPLWVRTAALFGIPYTTLDAEVAFWDYRQAKYADHETVMRYVSKGLFLDGDAAKELCRRGYGQYLGVEMGEDVLCDRFELDNCAREVICPPFDRYSTGTHMPAAQVYACGRNGGLLEIRLSDPKTEQITQVVDFQRRPVTPGMTRFENTLGGRIVVMGMTLKKNLSQSLFNYRRQRLFHALVRWCADVYVLAESDPNVYVIMNEPEDREKSGFLGMLTLINLGEDPVENGHLYLPPRWRSAAGFRLMNEAGEWIPVAWERTEETLKLGDTLRYCQPMYLLAE